MSGALNVDLLVNMVTDVAPALVARGHVSVSWYGSDVMIRLNNEPLMLLCGDESGVIAKRLRAVFA